MFFIPSTAVSWSLPGWHDGSGSCLSSFTGFLLCCINVGLIWALNLHSDSCHGYSGTSREVLTGPDWGEVDTTLICNYYEPMRSCRYAWCEEYFEDIMISSRRPFSSSLHAAPSLQRQPTNYLITNAFIITATVVCYLWRHFSYNGRRDGSVLWAREDLDCGKPGHLEIDYSYQFAVGYDNHVLWLVYAWVCHIHWPSSSSALNPTLSLQPIIMWHEINLIVFYDVVFCYLAIVFKPFMNK